MKKVLLTTSLLASLVLGAQAQWVEQATNLDVDKLASDVQVLDINTVWLTGQSLAPGAGQTGPAYQAGSRTTDGGNNWTKFTVTFSGSTTHDFAGLSAIDAQTAYVAMYKSGGGSIAKTTNGGVTWTKATGVYTNSSSFPNVIHMFDAKDGMSMGDPIGGYYEIYTTSDSGKVWTRVPNTNNQLSAQQGKEYGIVRLYDAIGSTIWYATVPQDTLVPVGGKIFKSTDKGLTWTSVQTPFIEGITQIQFTDADNGLIINYNGTQIMRTTDGGATWNAVASSGEFQTFDLAKVPGVPGKYYTCGLTADRTAYARSYTLDHGTTWIPMPGDEELAQSGFTRMAFVDDTHAYAGGYTSAGQGGVFRYDGVVGVKNNVATKENFVVYPNPSNSGVFFLNTVNATNIQVLDATGKVVYTANESAANGIKVDLSSMDKGLYLMKVTSGKVSSTQKLIVQ